MSSDSTVLITGASSGIGAVYADRFAKRGHNVVLVARDLKRLQAIAEQIQHTYAVKAEVIQADLSIDEDISRVERVLQAREDIDILVNNAGISLSGSFNQQQAEGIEQLLSLNINAVVRLSHAIAPGLTRKQGGAIINLGSVVGLSPEFGSTLYGASKAFIQFFSQGLSLELKGKGVYVQAVLPSATGTEIWQRSGADLARVPPLMDVNDLVDAALVGFDKKENITIPVLKDESQWHAYEAARLAMLPGFASTEVGERYKAL